MASDPLAANLTILAGPTRRGVLKQLREGGSQWPP
jgi:hypothetical protein